MQTKTHTFPLAGLLFLLFVYLRLTGHIDWSWWWVTAPVWIPIGVSLLAIAVCSLFLARRSTG